jgi:Lysyl oxidase
MFTNTFRVIVATVFVAGGLFAANVVRGARAGRNHLPDLRTRTPTDLQIVSSGGAKLLRFSNTVWNRGRGPLELRPESSGNTTLAYQRIYSHDDAGVWFVIREVLVGTFTFHPTHNHWHFDDFADYEIRNVNPDGSIGSRVERAGTKQTFCIADTEPINLRLEHAPLDQIYPPSNCDQNDIEGMSVGWGDKYGWELAGQSIDITGLPDGLYYLYSITDGANRIRETNNANNWAAVKIQIQGTTVTIVG